MRKRISLFWSAIILGAVGILYIGVFIFFAHPGAPARYSIDPISTIKAGQSNIGIPVFLVIPKINVAAAVAPVGLTSDGAMGVPTGPVGTAWFELGPRPGEVGSAVIAGHEGWKDGIAAVFDDLYKLQVGDKIYTQDDHGATAVFLVDRVETYNQNGNASGVFSSSDGKAHLNLITCEGTWNAAEKSYSNRLVVFADLVK